MADFTYGDHSTVSTYLTTELNSITDGSAVIGAEINNSSGDHFAKVLLELASFDLSSQTAPSVHFYIVRSLDDGTTYEDGSGSIIPARPPDYIFLLREVNAAQKVLIDIRIASEKQKFIVVNETGVTLASSGNTLKYETYVNKVV